MALPGNAEVADQFDLLADLLELEGAESFRVIAYRRAASRMRETSASIAQLALDGNAKKLQGIGNTIEEKIVEFVETGDIAALAKRRAGVPPEVVLFMRLPGLGPKTAARIWKELGVETLADLKAAAEAERLRTLAGLGAKSEDAVRRGLSISEYGVTNTKTGKVFQSADEDAVYEFLGYAPIPPELRENSGELEAARRGELPQLVEVGDVRGDLHTHSHWSADGKSTLEEMLEGAAARGYEYYAVTDHSHYLRGGRLQEQLAEIEQLRRRFPTLRILAGVEANIRSSGEVDVADEDLALLDWIVASVHNA